MIPTSISPAALRQSIMPALLFSDESGDCRDVDGFGALELAAWSGNKIVFQAIAVLMGNLLFRKREEKVKNGMKRRRHGLLIPTPALSLFFKTKRTPMIRMDQSPPQQNVIDRIRKMAEEEDSDNDDDDDNENGVTKDQTRKSGLKSC